jgi:hypothetical protein
MSPYRRCFISDDAFPETVYFPITMPLPMDDPRARDFLEAQQGWAAILVHPDIEDPPAFLEARKEFVQAQAAEHPGAMAVITPDGTMHWGKVVPVRISDHAVVEWMASSRDGNRVHGAKPDRPPDMDTATTRSWLRHPGESDAVEAEHDKTAVWPVMIVVHKLELPFGPSDEDRCMKMLVSYEESPEVKRYVFRIKFEHDGEVLLDREMFIPVDTKGDWLGEMIARLDEQFDPVIAVDDEPKVTTYVDFLGFEEEALLVRKEIAEYYGVPEDWQRLAAIGRADGEKAGN